MRRRPSAAAATAAAGFTLIELLVVMGIIVLLISILIPTVSKMRRAAQTASVKQQINELQGAIERFQQEQHQYPGPLPDNAINTAAHGTGAPVITNVINPEKITQSENLVLGLLGGLKYDNTGKLVFDPALIGKGMITVSGNQVKKFQPYIALDPKTLSTGSYSDGAGTADDSSIPEFLDRYPDPMPILYLRARTGAQGVVSLGGQDNSGWVVGPNQPTQYDLYDVLGYTKGAKGSIGEGKSISKRDYVGFSPLPSAGVWPHGLQSVEDGATLEKGTAGYQHPYNAFPYFRNPSVNPTNASKPNATGTPRAKDQYILISAGPDRVYGTEDDVCSFGSVLE